MVKPKYAINHPQSLLGWSVKTHAGQEKLSPQLGISGPGSEVGGLAGTTQRDCGLGDNWHGKCTSVADRSTPFNI